MCKRVSLVLLLTSEGFLSRLWTGDPESRESVGLGFGGAGGFGAAFGGAYEKVDGGGAMRVGVGDGLKHVLLWRVDGRTGGGADGGELAGATVVAVSEGPEWAKGWSRGDRVGAGWDVTHSSFVAYGGGMFHEFCRFGTR